MNLSKSIKHLIFRRYRSKVIARHQLDYLFWECTLRCNLSCLHCGSDCLKKSEQQDMPLEDFVRVLDDVKSSHTADKLTICITGGEPLLRNDLEDAGKEIIKRGFKWGIVTNGLILSEKRFFSLVNAGMSSMSFSIDGFEREHNLLRQNDLSFQNVMNAIKLASNFSKNGRFVFDVITCVNSFNYSTLRDFRKFLIDNGIKHWRIFSIFPEGRAGNNFQVLAISREQYRGLMDFISETRSDFGKEIHLNYSCEGYLGDYELAVRDYFFFCRAGINIASVMCNGDVTGCLSVRAKDFIQGNVYGRSFSDIWQNGYQIMRNRTWTKHGTCGSCKEWNKCLGNGMHLRDGLKGDVARCNLLELNNS
ncbi:MAG: TIGR04133 family radical SAM/SPASM protein [Bacteroidales bacterium]|nr:TIGR04133 family radical SAM/SPASM protein [Bacteroidales bacterium]